MLLVTDFDALNGSVFRAYIEACSGSFVSSPDAISKIEKPRLNQYFKEDASAIALNIYPNPTRDIFNIELENTTLSEFSIEIYSMSRGLMFSNSFEKEDIESFQVDIAKFPEGIYIVKLVNLTTNEIYTGKIMKDN